MKKIKLTESELISMIENLVEQSKSSKKFSVEPFIKKTPREKELQGAFGSYEKILPNDLLRYMRKNPQTVMNRLAEIYGDKFLEYAEEAFNRYQERSED
jgi:hypothetical protein